jgi:esterase/lipase superfamily enzyme
MNREYHQWHSAALNRNMELLMVGHAGARVLVFPTSQGRYFEWQDRGMFELVRDPIERGLLQFICVDSVDAESWYCGWAHPSGRALRHLQYDHYLYEEVLPFSLERNANPFLMTLGASFGGYHAMNFGLRHPDAVKRILAFSGLYDIRRFVGDYYDESVYFNNPVDFIPNEHDPARLNLLRQQDIVIATGREDRLMDSAQRLTGALWAKGIGNALREWDGWSHDWPYWEKMLTLYISGHD